MNKYSLKRIAPLLLAVILTVTVVSPAAATALSKTIDVFTGVTIYVDDAVLDAKDANGDPVEAFIYKGTTYLPVRAVSEALDVPIQWEGKTKSVYLESHTSDSPAVWLKDMDYFAGTETIYSKASMQDNMGNSHFNCITSRKMDRIYILNGQYSRITGTIFQDYDSRSATLTRSHSFHIYGDGELLYEIEFPADSSGIRPVYCDIDLEGVLELQVKYYLGYSKYSYQEDILYLGDCGLWT